MTASSSDFACIELVELVTDYFEGVLPDAERSRIERHLRECDGCTRYIEQIRQVIAAAGHLTPDDVPAPVMKRLLAVFRESRPRRPDR